jgi:hypothetical protein
MRMEVDRKAPDAQLYQPIPDPQRRDTLLLSWSATDRNPIAVKLEWAIDPNGPWQPIGEPELPHQGQHGKHAWQLPPTGMPPQVYLRLTVRDTAGNEAVAQTPTPVLIDLTEPEVRILSVGGGGNR